MLTKEELQQKRERSYLLASVPHPDPQRAASGERVDIRLRNMFGGEWISLIRSTRSDESGANWRSENISQLVLAFCLVDEHGKRLLTDDDLNTAWWKTQSVGFLTEAVDAAMRHSNLDTPRGVGDERKNSPAIGNSDCSIELPSDLAMEPPEIVSTTLG